MGRLETERGKNLQTFGIMRRAMDINDPSSRARLLSQATHKLQEYREANAGLSRENERLKLALDAALRYVAELTGKPYPPVEETVQ